MDKQTIPIESKIESKSPPKQVMCVLKKKKKKYYLHKSSNFKILHKGLFLGWKFTDCTARLMVNNIVLCPPQKDLNVYTIREALRKIIPTDKELNLLFNIENIISNRQIRMLDFFNEIDKPLLDSTIANIELEIKFIISPVSKKARVTEYYYELPKSIIRPVGNSIDLK